MQARACGSCSVNHHHGQLSASGKLHSMQRSYCTCMCIDSTMHGLSCLLQTAGHHTA